MDFLHLHPRTGERALVIIARCRPTISSLTTQLAQQSKRQQPACNRRHLAPLPPSLHIGMLWTRTHTGLSCFPLFLITQPSLGTLGRAGQPSPPRPEMARPTRNSCDMYICIWKPSSRSAVSPTSCILPPESHPPPHSTGTAGPMSHERTKSQASITPVLPRLVPPRQSSSRRCGYTKLRQTGLINWGVNGTAQTDNPNNPALFSRAAAASKACQTGKSLPRTSQPKKATIVPYYSTTPTDRPTTNQQKKGDREKNKNPTPFSVQQPARILP